MGVAYKTWLELEAAAKEWEASKFDLVDLDGVPTVEFTQADGLVPMKNAEATGKGSDDEWTVLAAASFRWKKMHNAGGTGMVQAAGFAVNPCNAGADMTDVDADFQHHLEFHCDDPNLVNKICSQWEDCCAHDENGPPFKVACKLLESRDCEASGGTKGARWWKCELPREKSKKWAELRFYAIRVLSQTSTETAAERHFSLMEVAQSRADGHPWHRENGRPCLRPEILQELSESVAAINTVEEIDAWNARQEPEAMVDEHGASAVQPALPPPLAPAALAAALEAVAN